MELRKVDPRALKENPDRARHTTSNGQADALMLATIRAVGIVQPPVAVPETGGGNGFVVDAGHRRVRLAIAAGLEEIEVLVTEAASDGGAMRSMVENAAREPLNPVDQWWAIERLVALGWTAEAIGVALGFAVRQIRSCGSSPTCYRPCSTTWPRATCRTSVRAVFDRAESLRVFAATAF